MGKKGGAWEGRVAACRARDLKKEMLALLDLCVSSLRRGHANLLCIVPILFVILSSELLFFVGFLLLSTLRRNFTGVSTGFTGISPESHRNFARIPTGAP